MILLPGTRNILPTDVTPKPAERQLAEVSAQVAKYRPGCPVIDDELYYICDNNAEKGANRGCNWRASNVVRRYVLDFAGGCVASAPMTRRQAIRLERQGDEDDFSKGLVGSLGRVKL